MERLTEKDLFMGNITFNCGEHEKDCDGNCQDKSCGLLCAVVKKLKEYEDLEEQGKLLKLPCAVGDTVYEVDKAILSDERIEPIECKVDHITVFKTNIYFSVTIIKGHGSGSAYEFEIKDFGKTVFLTREEAEATLKALEG